MSTTTAPSERQHHTVDLAAPAVATATTTANLDVVIHDGSLKRLHYNDVPVSRGSAVFVNADGVLVTSDSTVVADHAATVRRGVNLAFHDLYGVALPADPAGEMEVPEALHHRLQDCYEEAPDADCAVFSTLITRVSPYVAKPAPGGEQATLIDADGPLALLRLGGTNNPTDAIASAPPSDEQAVVVIGFPDNVTAGAKPVTIGTHIKVDGPNVSLDDADMIRDQLMAGWAGAAVVDLQNAQLVGLIAGDSASPERVLPASAVSAALKSVPIDPLRSAVDSDYAAALDYFFARHYTHSLNDFQAVLRLNPQHALAAVHLQQSQDLAGKPGDMSTSDDMHPVGDQSSSSSWAWWLGLGVLVLVALAVAAVLLRRRGGRNGSRTTPVGPEPSAGPEPFVPARVPSARMTSLARRLLGRDTPDAGDVGDASEQSFPGGGLAQASPPPTRAVDVGARGVPVAVGAAQSTGAAQPASSSGHARTTGGPVSDPVFCEQCGSHLGVRARFCGQCAAPVRR